MTDAQALFYNGRYDAAAALALDLIEVEPDNLRRVRAAIVRAALSDQARSSATPADKDKALKQCAAAATSLRRFNAIRQAESDAARAQLKADPRDDNAQFMLGKLDLNHVWLHLGTLGRRTGWNEYWEARHSLDAVLERNPRHMRARLARAWIDYIVDTRMTWGTRWMLGGGNKKKALAIMREAASTERRLLHVGRGPLRAVGRAGARKEHPRGALVTARSLTDRFSPQCRADPVHRHRTERLARSEVT